MQITSKWVISHNEAPFTGNILKPKFSFRSPQAHQLFDDQGAPHKAWTELPACMHTFAYLQYLKKI